MMPLTIYLPGPLANDRSVRSDCAYERGFSLVEVTLALAIAALGILTIMGLMPVGIKNVKDAGFTVTSSRIYQEMVGELQSMDWGTYSNGFPGWSRLNNLQAGQEGARRYFDGEGSRISESDEDFEARLTYVAEFFFTPVPVHMTGVTTTGGDMRRDMRHVIIRLAESSLDTYVFRTDGTGTHHQRAFTLTRPY